MKKILIFLVLIFAVSLPLCFPLFKQGYFPTHDGEWAVVRLGAMHRALIDREFPVRWAGNQNYGFGYPLFEFTYPFPYYFAEIFNLAKLGLVNSIKIVFALSVFVSAVSMFVLSRELFGNLGGLISSLFYIYAPYRIVNLYVRGSIGESLSLAIFPILFYLLLRFRKTKNLRFLVFFSLTFSTLLLTHNVTALVFFPFLALFAFILFLKEKKPAKFYVLGSFLIGGLASSFFLVPLLLEKNLIILSRVKLADISEHFVPLDKLINSAWGFGAYGTPDSFSPQVGLIHFLAFAFSLFVILKFTKNKFIRNLNFFFVFSFLILIFLMQPLSLPFWQNVPLFSDVDFPWRLLTPLIFFLSIPLGSLAFNKKTLSVGLILSLLAIYFILPKANPKNYIQTPDSYYFTNEATTTSADELMPLWVKEKPKARKEKIEVLKGDLSFQLIKSNSIETKFKTSAADNNTLQLNTIYYPGWKVSLDGKDTKINYENKTGVMRFEIPKGEHLIDARFTETPLRIISDLISLFSLAVLGFIFIFFGKFNLR